MKPTQEEIFKDRVRIASSHLMRVTVPSPDLNENFKRFDEVLDQAKDFPYVKSHIMQKADFTEKRLAIEARFVAIAIGSDLGYWLPKRVIVINEHDAIVESVCNENGAFGKPGDIRFDVIVNGQQSISQYTQLDHALLHYLSQKHEGDSLAANRAFVRHTMAMLKYDESNED